MTFPQYCGQPDCLDAHERARAASTMLREANHRIANSLQVVIAASRSPIGTPANGAGNNTLAARIAAIAALHRMLSTAGESPSVQFGDYLERLIGHLSLIWAGPTSPQIVLHHEVGLVEVDIASRLGMVINELVTNALKYAYRTKQPGEIRVRFSVSEVGFILVVADDGAGIDTDTAQPGMGTRIIADLVKRMSASFTYRSDVQGTVAVLSGAIETLDPAGRTRCARAIS